MRAAFIPFPHRRSSGRTGRAISISIATISLRASRTKTAACARYKQFLDAHKKGNILFLELGVGMNTPGIIKYPFWQMTYRNKTARYVCVNPEIAYAPEEISSRSVCIAADLGRTLKNLLQV